MLEMPAPDSRFSSGAADDPRHGYPGYTVSENVLPGSQPPPRRGSSEGRSYGLKTVQKKKSALPAKNPIDGSV